MAGGFAQDANEATDTEDAAVVPIDEVAENSGDDGPSESVEIENTAEESPSEDTPADNEESNDEESAQNNEAENDESENGNTDDVDSQNDEDQNVEPEAVEPSENSETASGESSDNSETDDSKPEEDIPSENDASENETPEEEIPNEDNVTENEESESENEESESGSENSENESENSSESGSSSENSTTENEETEGSNEESTENSATENGSADSENSSENTGDSATDDSASAEPSTEAPAFSCQSVGRFVHPDSCEKYYFCWDSVGTYAEFSCSHSHAFDPLTKTCVQNYAICESAPKCQVDREIITIEDDKSTFFECKWHSDGLIGAFELRKHECVKGREYDPEVGFCKLPAADDDVPVDSEPSDKFVCQERGIFIDFKDETKYIECIVKSVEKGILKTVHRKCPKKQVFSFEDMRCVLPA